MTPEAQELLTLLENLDHTDKAACDEFNRAFKRYLFEYRIERETKKGIRENVARACYKLSATGREINYLKSLDAIKEVEESELEGWFVGDCFYTVSTGYKFSYYNPTMLLSKNSWLTANGLPTEQIARLHALIQAIDYKRSKG